MHNAEGRYSQIEYYRREIGGAARSHPGSFESLAAYETYARSLRATLKRLIQAPLFTSPPVAETRRVASHGVCVREHLSVSLDLGFTAPAFLWRRHDSRPGSAVIFVPGAMLPEDPWGARSQGKWKYELNHFAERLAEAGIAVLIPDLSPMDGESAHGGAYRAGPPEFSIVASSLAKVLGISYVGFQANLLNHLATYLRERPEVTDVGIVGFQAFFPVAMAAAVNPRLRVVVQQGRCPTWARIARDFSCLDPWRWEEMTVPGLLKHGDMQHVAALAVPRPLLLSVPPTERRGEVPKMLRTVYGLYPGATTMEVLPQTKAETMEAHITEFLTTGFGKASLGS
ncbi:MAG: hypothetical protein HY318_10415 [Armatimonadetes bacterium]|nr:hypothetical protein [Armatimonadota bacterium]